LPYRILRTAASCLVLFPIVPVLLQFFPQTAPRTIEQQRDFIRKSAMPPMNEAERIAINMIRGYGGEVSFMRVSEPRNLTGFLHRH
jgi:hypothetical protein